MVCCLAFIYRMAFMLVLVNLHCTYFANDLLVLDKSFPRYVETDWPCLFLIVFFLHRNIYLIIYKPKTV